MKETHPARATPGRAAGLAPYVLAGALFVLWVVYGLLSRGTMNDDDVTRYAIVRRVFAEPRLLIHMWGRPLFMVLYAIPARFGYAGVEVMTAAVSALTVLVTARMAAASGVRLPLFAAALTAVQPFFFKMGYSALVEPLAALCLALALWNGFRGRHALAALAAGLIPTARLEMAPLIPLVLLPTIRARQWRVLPLVLIPSALWSLGGTLAEGDPLWLANALLHGRMTRSLPPLPFANYFRSLPMVTGGVMLPLFAAGWIRRGRMDADEWKRDVLRAIFLVQFVVLVILAWDKIHFGASIGYLRHFVALAPVIGVLAAHGLDRWERRGAPSGERAFVIGVATLGCLGAIAIDAFSVHRVVWEHPSNPRAEPWIWSVGGVVGYAWLWWSAIAPPWRARGLAVLAAAAVLVAEPPMGLNPERQSVLKILETIRERGLGDRIVAVNHPWFAFLSGHDVNDRSRFAPLTQATLPGLPVGSLVAWDSHFGHRLSADVPVDYFKKHREYRLVSREQVGAPSPFVMFLFEKTAEPLDGP